MVEPVTKVDAGTAQTQGKDISGLPRKPRVSIFVESINGFGHFNVAKEVAKSLKNQGVDVCIVSSTASSDYAQFDFGDIDHVRLPSVSKSGVVDAGLSQVGIHPARQSAIRRHLREFEPDVVLSEFYPFMMQYRDGDMQTITKYNQKLVKKGGVAVKVISIARDIIHAQGINGTDGILERLEKYFDEVVVRGDGRFVSLEESEEAWNRIKNLTYTGNIVADLPARERMPFEERPVIVNAGGGFHESDVEFYSNAIKSRLHTQELKHNPWKIAVSKSCPEADFESLQKLVSTVNEELKRELTNEGGDIASFRPIELTRIIPADEYKHAISNAAAAVTRGSYNNNFELIRSEIPYVISPRPKKKEQLLRAKKVDEHGFGKALYHKEYGETDLAAALDQEVLERPNREVPELDFNGSDKMAEHIKHVASERLRKVESLEIA